RRHPLGTGVHTSALPISPDAPTADAPTTDASDVQEAGSADGGADADAASVVEAGKDAGCVSLTVKNYAAWCSVSVAGGTASVLKVRTRVGWGQEVAVARW